MWHIGNSYIKSFNAIGYYSFHSLSEQCILEELYNMRNRLIHECSWQYRSMLPTIQEIEGSSNNYVTLTHPLPHPPRVPMFLSTSTATSQTLPWQRPCTRAVTKFKIFTYFQATAHPHCHYPLQSASLSVRPYVTSSHTLSWLHRKPPNLTTERISLGSYPRVLAPGFSSSLSKFLSFANLLVTGLATTNWQTTWHWSAMFD